MATMIQKSSVPENPRPVSQALTADTPSPPLPSPPLACTPIGSAQRGSSCTRLRDRPRLIRSRQPTRAYGRPTRSLAREALPSSLRVWSGGVARRPKHREPCACPSAVLHIRIYLLLHSPAAHVLLQMCNRMPGVWPFCPRRLFWSGSPLQSQIRSKSREWSLEPAKPYVERVLGHLPDRPDAYLPSRLLAVTPISLIAGLQIYGRWATPWLPPFLH